MIGFPNHSLRRRLRHVGAWLAVVVALGAPVVTAHAAGTKFISGLNDVPLMPELSALGDTLVFDKPGGRIAEAVFTGPVSAESVRGFYTQTLPQLGWRSVGGGGTTYARDNEELILHVGGDRGGTATTLRVVLRPRR